MFVITLTFLINMMVVFVLTLKSIYLIGLKTYRYCKLAKQVFVESDFVQNNFVKIDTSKIEPKEAKEVKPKTKKKKKSGKKKKVLTEAQKKINAEKD